mgnify:FL=1|nr:MAG TPA: hypothetical protein [Caudoviricetes sp.]
MVNEKSTLRELEEQARNTKRYVDRLVKANVGLTLEEILRLGLGEPQREAGKELTPPIEDVRKAVKDAIAAKKDG